jgi:hypothetical protein
LALGLCLCGSRGAALAQDAAIPRARQLFADGLRHDRAARYAEAAEAFRAAFELRPSFEVLFNLGLVYAKLGRAIDAVETLTRYLDDGGAAVPAANRADAETILAEQRRLVGALVVQVSPAGATVRVDGRERGTSAAPLALSLDKGPHTITVTREGYAPADRAIMVAPGENPPLVVALARIERPRGAVAIDCPVEAMRVIIDGHLYGETPVAQPVVLEAGHHDVAFTRAGYAGGRVGVEIAAGTTVRARCDAALATPFAPGTAAALRVVASVRGAHVLVDGALLPGDGLIPVGRHRVDVLCGGYEPWTGEVTLRAPSATLVDATLRERPPPPDPLAAQARRRRTWATVAGVIGGGGLIAGAAAGAFVWTRQPIILGHCVGIHCNPEGKDAADAARRAGAASEVAFTTAAIGLATMTILLATTPRSARPSAGTCAEGAPR